MSAAPAESGAFGSRPVLPQARAAEVALASSDPDALWALGGAEVAECLGLLEDLRARAQLLQVAVMAEAAFRGLGSEEGWGAIDWASALGTGMTEQHAGRLLKVARVGDDHRLSELSGAVATGALPVVKAAQICRFHTEVSGIGDATELAAMTSELVRGASGNDGLTGRQLAIAINHAGRLLKPEPDLVNEERVRRAHRALDKSAGPAGMTTTAWSSTPKARPSSTPRSTRWRVRTPAPATTRSADADTPTPTRMVLAGAPAARWATSRGRKGTDRTPALQAAK